MRKEVWGLLALTTLAVTESAFSIKVRKEIGKRDQWTCQYPKCDDGTGQPKSFRNGWMVFAGHIKTHEKGDAEYDLASSGRIHCIEHEIAFHRRLLKMAEMGFGNLRQHQEAIRKLERVDERTWDFRKHPEKYRDYEKRRRKVLGNR